MRKLVVLFVLLALALPVAGLAGLKALRNEGTLSVDAGRGIVTVKAKGGVIGRLDRGTVTIWDLTPNDAYEARVVGDDRPVREIGENGLRYAGNGLRFRLVGGEFRITVTGVGIDLSAVGRGWTFVNGVGAEPGLFSLDGVDCSMSRAACKPLPEVGRRFQLGGPERGNPNSG